MDNFFEIEYKKLFSKVLAEARYSGNRTAPCVLMDVFPLQLIASNVPRSDVLARLVRNDVLKICYVSRITIL